MVLTNEITSYYKQLNQYDETFQLIHSQGMFIFCHSSNKDHLGYSCKECGSMEKIFQDIINEDDHKFKFFIQLNMNYSEWLKKPTDNIVFLYSKCRNRIIPIELNGSEYVQTYK